MAHLFDRLPRKSERRKLGKSDARIAYESVVGRFWPAKTRRRNGVLIRFRQSPNKRRTSAEHARAFLNGWGALIARL